MKDMDLDRFDDCGVKDWFTAPDSCEFDDEPSFLEKILRGPSLPRRRSANCCRACRQSVHMNRRRAVISAISVENITVVRIKKPQKRDIAFGGISGNLMNIAVRVTGKARC
jgi:hypothetical protein